MKADQISLDFPLRATSLASPIERVPIDDFFPEEEANRLAEVESYNKHLFRPNTYLHKWWARRSGTTFRYILKQLVPDASRRGYYTSGGLEGLSVLDPMLGGGTILHEAIRLGANVVGFDIDPIPVLQALATLSTLPLTQKKEIFLDFSKFLSFEIGRYYKTRCPRCSGHALIQFTLYGLIRKYENKEIIVTDSNVLREEPDGSMVNLDTLYPSMRVELEGRSLEIIDKEEAQRRKINGRSSEVLDVSFAERYVPIAIQCHCEADGIIFKSLDLDDVRLIQSARNRVQKEVRFPENDFRIPDGPKSSDLLRRNISYFYELFFPRQLLYISKSNSYLQKAPPEHSLWLALLVSTSLEFNSALCGYKGAEKRRPGAIRHVFSHHAYSFPRTALENNPIFPYPSSGTLANLFENRIISAGRWAKMPLERRYIDRKWQKFNIPNESDSGEQCSGIDSFAGRTRMFILKQNDSTHLPLPMKSIDFIVTDPPYFDSVQYSDLSRFFRCWLRVFLPDSAQWDYISTSSAVAETSNTPDKFGNILSHIWKECARVLRLPHGRLIFTYHHWNPAAWAQLTVSLKKANFVLINRFVVHSENPTSVHIVNLRALKHDVILVLKPGVTIKKNWTKPQSIGHSNSYEFCKACGQMIGWLLEKDLSEAEISEQWHCYLKGLGS